jgi:hypothetical protein
MCLKGWLALLVGGLCAACYVVEVVEVGGGGIAMILSHLADIKLSQKQRHKLCPSLTSNDTTCNHKASSSLQLRSKPHSTHMALDEAHWAVERATGLPEVWALVAEHGDGLVDAWRLMSVCRASRAGAKDWLGTLPGLVVCGGWS